MARLRAPGGCPWDREQSFETIKPYLLEETYEVMQAIDAKDWPELREELGDLLLQSVFFAQMASEEGLFSIGDSLDAINQKLIRRHPHVFGDAERTDTATLNETWEQQKIDEKGRTSAVDGVPMAQPALALAAKLAARARRADLNVVPARTSELGERLFTIAREASEAGLDPETALRETARAYRAAMLAAEAGGE